MVTLAVLGACGGDGKEQTPQGGTAVSKEEGCRIARQIQDDNNRARADLAAGKLDLGQTVAKVSELNVRVSALAQTLTSGDFRQAVERWAASRDRSLQAIGSPDSADDASAEAENRAAVEAVNRMCS
ncbi:MAG TPA: hypothetical protein VK988_11270 [Acidimicrobiales bacterium]|nr:hypothetical protein [Acidimicrobiales bacterium]